MNRRAVWRGVLWIGIALWTMGIWCHSLMPARVSAEESGWIVRFLSALFGWAGYPVWLPAVVRKCAHLAEFGVLGLAWGGQYAGCRRRWMWLCGVVTACVDEGLQFLAPGRSPQLTDVMIDVVGYVFGFALMGLFLHLWRKKKK